MPKLIDLSGKRFGMLTVVARGQTRTTPGGCQIATWQCLCDCGRATNVQGTNLRSGASESCGCVRTKHGARNTPEYKTWTSMIDRCTNPKNKAWARYGGRGISVCDRWKVPANFLADMGPRPSPRHTIDRIDNNGRYEPGNCRWATPKEQGRNRSDNRVIVAAGRACTSSEWSETTGIGRSTIVRRIERGWSPERAVKAGA